MDKKLPLSSFIKSDLIVLDEGITIQKCNFFKTQILAQLRKLVNQRPNEILLNWNTELAEVEKLYDIAAEKLVSATDTKYPSIRGTEPFNPNKYIRDLLSLDSIQNQINNSATLKLGSIFYTIKHNLKMAIEDYDKRIEYVKLWDLASKLKMTSGPVPPVSRIYAALSAVPSPVANYWTGISYLKDLVDNNVTDDKKDIIQKLTEWMVDKSDCKFDLLYSDNGIDIIHPLDGISYLKFGFGTQWCTSIPSLQSGILQSREIKILDFETTKDRIINSIAEYPDAIIVIKNDKPMYQMDFKSHQYMDVNDENFLIEIKQVGHFELSDEYDRSVKGLINFVNDLDYRKIVHYFESTELLDNVVFDVIKPPIIEECILERYRNKRDQLRTYKPEIPFDSAMIEAFKSIYLFPSIKDIMDYDFIVKSLVPLNKRVDQYFAKLTPDSNVIRARDWVRKAINVYNSPMKDDAINWLKNLGRTYAETGREDDLLNDIPDVDYEYNPATRMPI